MVKLSIFVQRRADLSHEQFADYWMNVHWPLVRSVPEVQQYTRRYVQLHPIQVSEGLPVAPYDGIGEAWFDGPDDILKLVGSKGWTDIVQKDDPNFLDPLKTRILISEEKVDFNFAEREG